MRYDVRLIDEDSSNKIRINCESEGRVGRFKFSEGLIAKTRRVSRQRTRSHTEIRVDKREAATPADDDAGRVTAAKGASRRFSPTVDCDCARTLNVRESTKAARKCIDAASSASGRLRIDLKGYLNNPRSWG